MSYSVLGRSNVLDSFKTQIQVINFCYLPVFELLFLYLYIKIRFF